MEPRRVLVVEDNRFLCTVLEETLRDAGYKVIGPFTSLALAQEAMTRQSVDAAVLDINISGELVFPLAVALKKRGIAIVLTSGHKIGAVPASIRGLPQLRKPYGEAELLGALLTLFGETQGVQS
jgi:DNA-binding response OmpR family regulator